MPSRIISSNICMSESLANLSWFEQMFFLRLIVSADDYGRYDARPQIIKGHLFPFDDVTVKVIENALLKLSTNGMISLYKVAEKPYLELCAWRKYNTPRAKESKYPGKSDSCEDESPCNQMQSDENICNQMQSDSPDIRNSIFDIRNSIFGDSVGADAPTTPVKKAKKFIPPTLEEVTAYCQERNNGVNPERFIDYYSSNGWKVGKNPMKDWKAAVRTWENSGYNNMTEKQIRNAPAKGASGYMGDAELAAIRRTMEDSI